MMPPRMGVAFVPWLVGVALLAGAPGTAEAIDARPFLEKATAAYALGHYADAAENFERAFELKPDLALLYNAAQSHRLAGNKERALTLYRGYMRVAGKKEERRADVEAHIKALEEALSRDQTDKKATISPPAAAPMQPTPTSAPGLGDGAPPAPKAPAAGAASPAVSVALEARALNSPPSPVVAASAPPPMVGVPAATPPPATPPAPVFIAQSGAAAEDHRPLTRRPWFWGAVGGSVVVAAVVVLLVASGGSKDPRPNIGRWAGN